MRALIVGCGYVGLPVAVELINRGHQVIGIRRSEKGAGELRAARVEPHLADISSPDFTLPEGRFDWVIFTAAAGRDADLAAYQQLYVQGTRQVLARLADCPPAKYVYTSSTSVYGQQDGSLVKETGTTDPTTPTAQALLETEKILLDAARAGFPAVVLRVAGIYGPGRGHLFQKYLRNEATIPGRGLRHLNMIHRDDVVGAILAVLQSGRPREIYNVVDEEPVTEIQFFAWMSETLGKWLPPFGPEEPVADRRRALTNKKVSSRKLTMELGYRFKYPTFRQGYTAEIKSLTDAGLLDIKPEPR